MTCSIQEALAKTPRVALPSLPSGSIQVSWRAVALVRDPLPAPATCPNCGSAVTLVNNSAIYGRECGNWPWAYLCTDRVCDSYVGVHPSTDIPLGTLANAPLRAARKKAKAAFNPLWQSRSMTRSQAYAWLAGQLGLDAAGCHIGWFDLATCERATNICSTKGSPCKSTNM